MTIRAAFVPLAILSLLAICSPATAREPRGLVGIEIGKNLTGQVPNCTRLTSLSVLCVQ